MKINSEQNVEINVEQIAKKAYDYVIANHMDEQKATQEILIKAYINGFISSIPI
ncbi:hypothetical protein [Pedobacter agri]|uniref:hypothetical protein n=1 Tax=Pedobacter agri TaxID=454586 RepID=UPI00292DF829|nr:hypothetical protein [Pedobacter agri]